MNFRHNDFPFSIRKYQKGEFTGYNITDLTETEPWNDENFDKFGSHTDILRLRQGKVGAQVIVSQLKFFIDIILLISIQ